MSRNSWGTPCPDPNCGLDQSMCLSSEHRQPTTLRLVTEYPKPDQRPIAGRCVYCGHEADRPCVCEDYGHRHQAARRLAS